MVPPLFARRVPYSFSSHLFGSRLVVIHTGFWPVGFRAAGREMVFGLRAREGLCAAVPKNRSEMQLIRTPRLCAIGARGLC